MLDDKIQLVWKISRLENNFIEYFFVQLYHLLCNSEKKIEMNKTRKI